MLFLPTLSKALGIPGFMLGALGALGALGLGALGVQFVAESPGLLH